MTLNDSGCDKKNTDTKKVFSIFANEDSLISRENAVVAARCLGCMFSENNIQDLEKDELNFDEFKNFLISQEDYSSLFTKEEIRKAFRTIDPEETGYVKSKELFELLCMNGNSDSFSEVLTKEDISGFFQEFPPDLHGNICYEVLLNLFDDK